MGDGGAEFEDALARCKNAWEPDDGTGIPVATDGIITLMVNQFTEIDGSVVQGFGGAGKTGRMTGPRTAIIDVAYLQPDTGFTLDLIQSQLGVSGDWQEKVFGHETGHALSLSHIEPLMCGSCDNLMQYQLPLDPDPAVSMFGTLLNQNQIDQVVDFACGNIGGVENCPPQMAELRIGSLADARAEPGAIGFGDIVATAISQRPGSEDIALEVPFGAALPEVTFFQTFVLIDADNDPTTGGDASTLLPPGFFAPPGAEIVALAALTQGNGGVFRFDGAGFELLADTELGIGTRPDVVFADSIAGGASFEAETGYVLEMHMPGGDLAPLGDAVAIFVQTLAPLPDGGAVGIDVLRGRVNLLAPVFPSCTVAPEEVAQGGSVAVGVEGPPGEADLLVYLGDRLIGIGETGPGGAAEIDVGIPDDARSGKRLVTVGLNEPDNAMTADCEVKVTKANGVTDDYQEPYRDPASSDR
jgi:hypothetical protein